MLGGLCSLVWAFFSPLCIFCLTSPFPTGSMSFCAGIAGPGLRCFPRVFSSCEQGLLFSCGARASHCSGFSCGARAPGTWASVTAGHRLSCCMAYGIFLDHQISNPYLLPWQVNSFPLAPRGSPVLSSFFFFNWSIVPLQCCVSFWYTADWFSYIYILFQILCIMCVCLVAQLCLTHRL